jgi:hypothetical protein
MLQETTIKLTIPPQDFLDISPKDSLEAGKKFSHNDIPRLADLKWMSKYLGLTIRAIGNYRIVAYQHVPAYKKSVNKRNPDYIKKRIEYLKRVNAGGFTNRPPTPDPPPFEKEEAIILVAIASLYNRYSRQHGCSRLVAAHIADNPEFYLTEI